MNVCPIFSRRNGGTSRAGLIILLLVAAEPVAAQQAPGGTANYGSVQAADPGAETNVAPMRFAAQNYQPPPPPPPGADVGPPDMGGADLQSLAAQQQATEQRLTALEERTAPKLPLIKLGGFFQLDNLNFTQDAASRTTYGRMQDGTGFRRARLQAYGSVSESTNYIMEFDFATAGRPSFLDVWVEQMNLGWLGTVRIGNFRQPTTMDAWTSVRHLEFLERSDAFQALDPFRRVGIMSYNQSDDKNTTWAGSAYRTGFTFINPSATGDNENYLALTSDDRFATFIGNKGGWSTAWRATHLLWYDEPAEGRYLLHIGGGYNYSNIGSNGGVPAPANGGLYLARTIPGAAVGDPQFPGITAATTPFVINSGNIPARSFSLYHLELAGQAGPAHFQTEWLAEPVQSDTMGTIFVNGAYVQTGYFLTGENCGYNRQYGVMDYNVRPFTEFFGLGRRKGICGWGAWEVAARWDYLHIPNAGFTPPSAAAVAAGTTNAGTAGSAPNPGTLNQGTLALNWWWNQYTRVQFNWINVFQNSAFAVFGKSYTGVYALRFQVEF